MENENQLLDFVAFRYEEGTFTSQQLELMKAIAHDIAIHIRHLESLPEQFHLGIKNDCIIKYNNDVMNMPKSIKFSIMVKIEKY